MSETTEEDVDESTDVETTDDTTEPDTNSDDGGNAVNENPQGIVDSSTFASFLDSCDVLVDECKIHLNEDGMQIRAVDPANVGMVDATLAAAAFESYTGGNETIGVNLDRLTDIVGMADSGQLLNFELDVERRMLNIRIGGLTYNLALIDPDSIRQEPDIPDLDLPANIVAESSQLEKGINAADMVSDHITLSTDPQNDTFNIAAEGDTDDVDLELDADELIDLTTSDATSLFSLDYLKDMKKSFPSNTEVEVELGSEFPVKMHYEFAEGLGHVTFMLAPRIESE